MKNGWLREHNTSAEEVRNLFALADRDLADASRAGVSADWRFNMAYNAGLQLATLALYVAGFRAGRGESKHYRIIQALPLVMGKRFSAVSNYLDHCRRKRNVSEYDAVGTISGTEVEELVGTVGELKAEVEKWVEKKYPELESRD